MSGTIRIGIIGAGGIVRSRHMVGLGSLEDVAVVAVCNRSRESGRRFAADYGVPEVVENWKELIARDDVDVVWIGTWPYMHREISVAALEAGKHVFCQARMCRNLAEAREMVAAADGPPDRVTMICPPPMGMSGDRVMRRLLHQERYVGEIRHVHLRSMSGICLDPNAEFHWRFDKGLSGQNTFTLGIYVEVLNRWIGLARRVHAVGKIWTASRPRPETGERVPVEIPESLNIIAELASGGVGVYEFNGVAAHGPVDGLEIYGTEGTIHYQFDVAANERIFAAKVGDKELAEIPIGPDERREWTVEADFIKAVRTGDKSAIEPDFHDGIRYMAFIDAVHRSAESNAPADVEEV